MSIKQHDLSGQQLLASGYTIQVTTTTETEADVFIPDATGDYTINKVVVIPIAAITGQATNYGSFVVQDGGTAGTGTTALTGASYDFDDGNNGVAGTPIVLTATAANVLDGADVLRLRVTKTASGMTIPAAYWYVFGTGS